ncbi:tyrosine-type recombinase/integrase [Azospirillum argentinense]
MAFLFKPCERKAAALGTSKLARIPVLYDRHYHCHAPASRYLIDLGTGRWIRRRNNNEARAPTEYSTIRLPSDGSVLTYARQLEDFITQCERRRIDWQTVDYKRLNDLYKTPMMRGNLAPSTINGRFNTAVDFLTWAAHKGERKYFEVLVEKCSTDAFRLNQPRWRLQGKVRSHPKDLSLPDLASIEEWLEYLQRRDSHTAKVDALMVWTLLQTALRANELIRLRVTCLNPVKSPHPNSAYSTILVQYGTKGGREPGEVTQRGKPRFIQISNVTLQRLNDYIQGRRQIALRTFRRNNPNSVEPPEVFLSPDTGQPLAYRTFWGKWKIGPLPISQWSPHLGRHTWACYTLLDEVRPKVTTTSQDHNLASCIFPYFDTVLYTQIASQLGHISTETTQMYLRWVTDHLQISKMHREYGNWLDKAL